MSKKKKKQIKKIYVKPKEEYGLSREKKDELQKEIESIEEKRKNAPKGFKGAIYKLQANKAINERRGIINSARRSELDRMKLSQLKTQVNIAKTQNELNEARKKNQVNFDLGFNDSPKKGINLSDLGL